MTSAIQQAGTGRPKVERPRVVYGEVELHISSDTDFPAKHGAKVKRAGGKYSDVRGGTSRTRYVHLPASETALIDDIARSYMRSPTITVVVRKLSADGHDAARIGSAAGQAHSVVHKWRGEDRDGPLSAYLRQSFEARMDRLDWQPTLARWKAEDDAQAARARRWALDKEIASLREQIALEAVRIDEGANDIEPLKELARRYRVACREAGIELETGPAASLGMR